MWTGNVRYGPNLPFATVAGNGGNVPDPDLHQHVPRGRFGQQIWGIARRIERPKSVGIGD